MYFSLKMYACSTKEKFLEKYKSQGKKGTLSETFSVKIDSTGNIIKEKMYTPIMNSKKSTKDVLLDLQKDNDFNDDEKNILDELIFFYNKRTTDSKDRFEWKPFFINKNFTCKDNKTILNDDGQIEIKCCIPSFPEHLIELFLFPFGSEIVDFDIENIIECSDESGKKYNSIYDNVSRSIKINNWEELTTYPSDFNLILNVI